MTRVISAAVLAFIITMGLLLLMHFLIASNLKEPEQGKEYKIPDIVMPDRKVSEEFDTRKPDKPDEAKQPPPEIPEPEYQSPNVNTAIAVSAPTNLDLNISAVGGFSSDGDYLPIVKVEAKYPSSALSRGTEGYCTVQYTVATDGSTKDVEVYDCPQSVFARSSVAAAKKFKYKPKVVDGQPIEVKGVRNRFIFKMATE